MGLAIASPQRRREPAQTPMRTRFRSFLSTLLGAAALAVCAPAFAQLKVEQAWVRGTVAQQQASGLFARLTSPGGGRLVAASSPLATSVEIHEMAMDGNVMRMREVPALDLPAGQVVELKPGGYHLMLLGLKQPLKAGATVPATLVVEGKDGRRETVQVQATVRALGAPAPAHKP